MVGGDTDCAGCDAVLDRVEWPSLFRWLVRLHRGYSVGAMRGSVVDNASAEVTPYEEASIWIDAAVEVVWDAVAKIEFLGRYSPETTGAEWLEPSSAHAVGARFRGHNDNGSHTWHTDCEITDYTPRVVFGFGVGPTAEFRTIWRYRFTEERGGTRLTQSFESPLLANPPPGMNPDRRRVMADMLTETLERIRDHLEGVSRAAP